MVNQCKSTAVYGELMDHEQLDLGDPRLTWLSCHRQGVKKAQAPWPPGKEAGHGTAATASGHPVGHNDWESSAK